MSLINNSITVNDPAIKNVIQYIHEAKYNDAIKWIQNKAKEEEQVVAINDVFDAYPADGAHAFTQVLRQVYGWIEQKPVEGFWGPEPPQMIVVETGFNSRVEVPWGKVAVPNIAGTMSLSAKNDKGVWKFMLAAEVKKKDIEKVKDLCARTREYVRTDSIYRGQPVRLAWSETKGNAFTAGAGGFDTPRFMQPSGLQISDLILPEFTFEEIRATIFSLIRNAEKAAAMGVPRKRLVVLAGPFGTGKTLTATITAELCREMKRTFLYLTDVKHLADAIYFAQQYSPACVFAEDIDHINEQPALVDGVSNAIDGIDSKGIDVLFILTTNYIERLPQKFLRNGRSDMIITFTPPDTDATARLIVKYGGETLEDEFGYDEAIQVAGPLADFQMIPASIREVVERAKLFALAYNRTRISKVDLVRASHGVIEQAKLMAPKQPDLLPEHLEEFGMLVRSKNGGAIEKTVATTVKK